MRAGLRNRLDDIGFANDPEDTAVERLVLAEVSSAGELSYRVLDGVPDETPIYDPSGYRGGIESPGSGRARKEDEEEPQE